MAEAKKVMPVMQIAATGETEDNKLKTGINAATGSERAVETA